MTQPHSTAPRSLLLIAYFTFCVMALPGSVLNVAWMAMQAAFGVPLDALGVLLLAATCGSLLGSFFSGRLIERFGLGRYLVTGGAIMLLGLLGYGTAATWYALIAAAFTTILGFSFFNAGMNIFVSARYSAGQFNWLHAAYGVGQMIGPTLATVVIGQLGLSWHLPYLVVFVLIASVTGLLLLTRTRWVLPGVEARRPDAAALARPARPGTLETLRLPAVLLGMGLFFLTGGVITSTGQLSNSLLSARGIANAGFWISFYWTSFTLGRVAMGFIAHRVDHTVLIRVGILGALLGAALLWQTTSTLLNLIGLAVIGFACAPMYPTLIAVTHYRVAERYRANAIGFEMAAGGLGQSLFPGMVAWLAQRSSLDVVAPLLIVGMLAALVLHELAARRQRQAVAAAA